MTELTRAIGDLLPKIRSLITSARGAAERSINMLQVVTNFEIGRLLVEHQQKGAERAVYGEALLKKLAASLTEEFGRGFSRSNLEYMRRFFLSYQDRLPAISQTASGILSDAQKSQRPSGNSESAEMLHTPSAVSTLSWSHYVFLISIKNPDERSFYEIEASAGGWTLAELKRQFNAGLYERLALRRWLRSRCPRTRRSTRPNISCTCRPKSSCARNSWIGRRTDEVVILCTSTDTHRGAGDAGIHGANGEVAEGMERRRGGCVVRWEVETPTDLRLKPQVTPV